MNLLFTKALLLLTQEQSSAPAPVLGEFKHENYEPVPIPKFEPDLSGYDFGPRGPPNRKQRRAMSKKKKTSTSKE